MLKHRLTRIVLLAFCGMTASCAVSRPPSASPPQLIFPAQASTPCVLDRLPEMPTEADLEVAYMDRGARLISCEAARKLAVDTLLAERAVQEQWLRENQTPRRPRLWPW